MKYNPKNERVTCQFLQFLEDYEVIGIVGMQSAKKVAGPEDVRSIFPYLILYAQDESNVQSIIANELINSKSVLSINHTKTSYLKFTILE